MEWWSRIFFWERRERWWLARVLAGRFGGHDSSLRISSVLIAGDPAYITTQEWPGMSPLPFLLLMSP